MLAMAGGSIRHNEGVVAVIALLHARFAGRGRVFGSDQRVATGDGVHTYPDTLVVCGELVVSRVQGTETVHNPTLVVEVLSPSTRAYDLGDKLEHYLTTPTLSDLLVVDPDAVDVRHLRRTTEGWETRRFRAGSDRVDLVAHGVVIGVSELYPPAP